jgi:hypothetical protein
MSRLNLPTTVPFLPGNIFADPTKENYHKTQQFVLKDNTNTEKATFVREENDPNLIDSLRTKTPLNLTYGNKVRPQNDSIPRIQPPWLKFDRNVLRFYCFFQESVTEMKSENYRIRKCVIYYYLSDDTIHVSEPQIENSGISQGWFIKRQKITKQLGTENYFTWRDFNVGININFYERVFHIVDCDQFTRDFYNYVECPLGNSEDYPEDKFSVWYSMKELKIKPPDNKEYQEYIEVKLRGGHPNGGLDKYLQNDRKVLSFGVMWEDTTLEGAINLYTMNYFLADDTIEVKEIRHHNSGKDPYPLLLHRRKVPK